MLVMRWKPEEDTVSKQKAMKKAGKRTKMRRTIAAKAKKSPGTAAPAAIADYG